MASRLQQTQPCLFTVELIVSLGGADKPETREMVEGLNSCMCIWGEDIMRYMATFVNLVKSKTDELATTLDRAAMPTQQQTGHPREVVHENKIKALESEKQGLVAKLKQAETDLAELQNLRMLIKSYNAKCIELDTLRDETGRHSIWFNEQLQSLHATKTELEAKVGRQSKVIQELEGKLSAESLQNLVRQDLTEKDFTKKLQQKKVNNLLSFMDPMDKSMVVCPVPTLNGILISLKHVYNSWKNDGVIIIMSDVYAIPSFQLPNMQGVLSLAAPCQINLIHQISYEIGVSVEPPFKVQFKEEGCDTWMDIFFTDQIIIASVMYQMKHNHRVKDQRLVQNNQMLIIISLEQQVFKIDMTNPTSIPPTEIPCRLVVTDASYEIF